MALILLVSGSWINAACLTVFFIIVRSISKTDKTLWLSVRESYLHNADFWRTVIKATEENP